MPVSQTCNLQNLASSMP